MQANLDNIAIVLHEPHYPENIGAAARAAKNMGLSKLVAVEPVDCDLTRVLKMATHVAEDVVLGIDVFDDLRKALEPYHYVVGTTARTGHHRQTLKNPRKMAREIVSLSQHNRIALLFGPESRGLANHELKYCDTVITIPTSDFSSLNLAQAVMVVAYEIFSATLPPARELEPRLANRRELEGMYDHLSETLVKIHFLNPQNPEYWMNSIRRFVSRIGLQAREVKIIRGICRQIDWYCSKHADCAGPANGSSREP